MKKLLVLAFLLSQAMVAQEPGWPEITKLNKPWTRWWWPGSIVNQPDLSAALEKYAKAGLGGLEIAVIYGVKGQEDKFINYLSPDWMKMLTYTLAEAERLGLGIDLANGSGWPFGGPWVDPDDACKNINYKVWELKGGDTLSGKVEFIQQSLIRAVGQKPEISTLTDPISGNKNLQLYALDQIRFEKPLPLYTLMAYSDSGEMADLTTAVMPGGRLPWKAPPGNWTLYGLFQGWHGKQVERAGPGGEGDVIDHFSGRAINNYLKNFNEASRDFDLKTLRGFFNDSYEVDDASGQADWTDNLFSEFFLRRGYDLSGHLPALFQKDEPEKNERVLSDYRQTISDLILEKFTTSWTSWAHRQGKLTRNQAHGSPGNILDLYAASDIPETEGNEITRLKFASSAANVTGKPLISCEAATWLGEHFTSTPADIKRAADIFFLSGINHLFYHGTCFSPQDEPWPGFLFYAAVEFSPSNSLWNDLEGLNKYVAHVQSFLQQGISDNDVLVYFPVFDRYASYSRGMLEHFDAVGPQYNGTPFKTGIEEMISNGYSFDYISDLQLTNSVSYNGLIETEGNRYSTLLVPGCKYIPLETFMNILRLANDGAKIIFLGDLPANIAGWSDHKEKQALFEKIKNGIKFSGTNNQEVSRAVFGNGSLLLGKVPGPLLSFAGIRREEMADYGLNYVRRSSPSGNIYFVVNQSDKPFEGWLPLSSGSVTAAIFNPGNGRSGIAATRTGKTGTTSVYVQLQPFESLIINLYNSHKGGKEYRFYTPAGTPDEIEGTWQLTFLEGGPVLPSPAKLERPVSWVETGVEGTKNFSGTAGYSVSFKRPSGKADAWELNLGKVNETARILLNGEEIALLTGPDFKVTIDKRYLKPENDLEVRVSNLMANRIAWMDKNNIVWKKFYNINFAARMKENTKDGIFDASEWEPRESGLEGPVTILPVTKAKR